MFKEKICPEAIKRMQNDPEMIRNICILAHVDHGKTTLSDSLISNNQIINQKLAGKLKYMDSREDEQIRQITMKASSITLFHRKVQKLTNEQQDAGTEAKQDLYKINLMDSPGHVDFTNEVSSALRLSDGALVLIDVSEGISPQTLTVLRQAWDEKIRTCLVLNKIDRLILERNMNADDIFIHWQNIIEQVNVIISSFISETSMQNYINLINNESKEDLSDEEKDDDEDIEEENKFFYSPEKGNIAFTSSIDWWGLTIPSFSSIIGKKLNIRPRQLSRYLWGNFYYYNKKINRKPLTKNSKPMFVQFVMEPIIAEYRKEFIEYERMDSSELSKARNNLSATLRKRIPIDISIFNMVVNRLPSPKRHQKERLSVFWPMLAELPNDVAHRPLGISEEEYHTCKKIKESIENWDNSDDAPVVIFISKMQPIDSKSYKIATKKDDSSTESKWLIGFGRVFSGKIKKGSEMYVLGVTHSKERKDIAKAIINDIFIFMGGNNLKAVSDMGAGNIVGIGGLDNILLKMGTICSLEECPSFAPARLLGTGLIKVSIQPKNISEMPLLIEGLKKLDRADPSATFHVNEKGEYILETWGQIHLERWVKDLKDDFAMIDIEISEPIISFKETISLTNLRKESDFEPSEKASEWFETEEGKAESKDKKETSESQPKKRANKGKRKGDSDEEDEEKKEEENSKATQDIEVKQEQTDM